MMLLENTLLLVIGTLLTLVSLGLAALIARELWHLFRDLRGSSVEVPAIQSSPASQPRKKAFEDRETVERLIDHFQPEGTQEESSS